VGPIAVLDAVLRYMLHGLAECLEAINGDESPHTVQKYTDDPAFTIQ